MKKLKVGITGQPGFVGYHLFNFLGTRKNEIERIGFEDEYFYTGRLANFIKECDVIVHLAAINRHPDPDYIFKTNLELVQKIIEASEKVNHYPHIIFASSTQEEKDSTYGKSKFEGRKLFENWAQKHKAVFSGLIIPNVFGPFSKPFYNSVVATFSYQLTHDQRPDIDNDTTIKLLYIADLVEYIYGIIYETRSKTYHISHNAELKVSELLKVLEHYKKTYYEHNTIPFLTNHFEISLFNTFRSFIDRDCYNRKLLKLTDKRGYLIEYIKESAGGQSFFSLTLPGTTRGNHFHTRKIERFCVLQGEGLIRLRKVSEGDIIEIPVSGDEPSVVDIPIWYTHNITNTGKGNMLTMFWTNEIFNPENPDTFYEEV